MTPPSIAGFERNKQALEEEKARQDKTSDFGAKADMIYLLPGQTMLRVLPPYSEEGVFFKKIYKHRVKVADEVFYGLCPNMNSNEDCPICEKGEELYATKDEAAIEVAKELKPRQQYLYNVIAFSGPANKKGEIPTPGKVYVLETGVMVHRQIIEIDQDEAMGWADITNVQNGVNLFIKRTGAGLDTRYDVNAHGGGRTNILEWLQSNGIDPNTLTLVNLDEVYDMPSQEKLAEVARKIRKTPSVPQAQPVFQTASPQPQHPAIPNAPAPQAQPVFQTASPQPTGVPQSTTGAPQVAPTVTTTVEAPTIPAPPQRG